MREILGKRYVNKVPNFAFPFCFQEYIKRYLRSESLSNASFRIHFTNVLVHGRKGLELVMLLARSSTLLPLSSLRLTKHRRRYFPWLNFINIKFQSMETAIRAVLVSILICFVRTLLHLEILLKRCRKNCYTCETNGKGSKT